MINQWVIALPVGGQISKQFGGVGFVAVLRMLGQNYCVN